MSRWVYHWVSRLVSGMLPGRMRSLRTSMMPVMGCQNIFTSISSILLFRSCVAAVVQASA